MNNLLINFKRRIECLTPPYSLTFLLPLKSYKKQTIEPFLDISQEHNNRVFCSLQHGGTQNAEWRTSTAFTAGPWVLFHSCGL
jgi:hypothetical protein